MELLRVISNYALFGLGGLAFLALWGASVAFVYGRVARQPGLERFFWPALAVILPLAGALLYGLGRLAERVILPHGAKALPRRDATGDRIPGPPAPLSDTLPGEAQPPGCTLTIVAGPNQGSVFTPRAFPVTIGRGAGVGLALDGDRRVSRQHAVLYWHNGAVWLRDTGSLHGTQVNGRPVTDQALQDGDRIAIGDTIFLFRGQSRGV